MLTCNITRQLLPNYIDELLDDASKQEVDEHLAACPDCGALLRAMRSEIGTDARQDPAVMGEIRYLGKFRKQIVVAVIAAAILLLLLFAAYLKLFYWGSPVHSADMHVNAYSALHDDDSYFFLDFELQNGNDLLVDTRYLEDNEGRVIGVILTPRQIARNPLDDTGPAFEYGYHLSYPGEFRISVRYADDKVVYDMRDWVE